MKVTSEDLIASHRKVLNEAETRLNVLLKRARKLEGDEGRSHDKELQVAKDLVRLAHRQLEQLDAESDEAFANDRRGFELTLRELTQVIEAADHRLDSDEIAKQPDAQRHSAPRA